MVCVVALFVLGKNNKKCTSHRNRLFIFYNFISCTPDVCLWIAICTFNENKYVYKMFNLTSLKFYFIQLMNNLFISKYFSLNLKEDIKSCLWWENNKDR